MTEPAPRVGVVVIGRNEGERLRRCLGSVTGRGWAVVYVDSNSSDASVEAAKSTGVEVHEVDPSKPMCAARSRREGTELLTQRFPSVEFIQYIDGDCELLEDWMDAAVAALEGDGALGAVCGGLRERRPDATIYNRLCDMEWGRRVGQLDACGGIFLGRRTAIDAAGGFDPTMVFGEEADFFIRMRREGFGLLGLDRDMALHDADMTRFGQWWVRAERTGIAQADGAARYGRSDGRHYVRNLRSTLFWALIGPALALVSIIAAFVWSPWALLGLVPAFDVYALLAWRIYRDRRRRLDDPPRHASLYAASCVLAKWPQMLGALRAWSSRVRGRQTRWLEYKRPTPAKAGQP